MPVPEWVLTGLRQKEDEHGAIPLGRFERQLLAPRSEVEVRIGEVTAQGILCSYQGEENALVLLDFLQRRVSVAVPLENIGKYNG